MRPLSLVFDWRKNTILSHGNSTTQFEPLIKLPFYMQSTSSHCGFLRGFLTTKLNYGSNKTLHIEFLTPSLLCTASKPRWTYFCVAFTWAARDLLNYSITSYDFVVTDKNDQRWMCQFWRRKKYDIHKFGWEKSIMFFCPVLSWILCTFKAAKIVLSSLK